MVRLEDAPLYARGSVTADNIIIAADKPSD
jgi:hypothetical protein